MDSPTDGPVECVPICEGMYITVIYGGKNGAIQQFKSDNFNIITKI